VTPEDLEQQIIEYCAEIATVLGRKHHNTAIVEADDIRQELWMWASRRYDKIGAWLDETQDVDDLRRGQNALRKSLYRQGDKFCRTQKALRSGYQPRDEAFYPDALLDHLLPHAWTITDDIGSQHDEGPRPPSNPSEGGNRVTSLLDVQTGLSRLDKDDYNILYLRYNAGVHPEDIADEMGLSRTTVDRRLKRALRNLTNVLGGDSPWR
jgi:RNA polymerase sigma factor (sigma-70 family)